jgi:hypothetical protein
MDDVIKLTADLRVKAVDYGDEIAALIGISHTDLPAGVFGMIFNNLTLSLELISYYVSTWSTTTTTNTNSVEGARIENRERILLIQKMTFISILSSVEYCFKDYIRTFPKKIGECKDSTGRVYLSSIINTSHLSDLISDSDFELWNGLIHLRNCLVHNNGVAQETKVYSYPDSQLVFAYGQMTEGNLKLFPHLIDWLLNSSKIWIGKIHTEK